MCGIAGVVARTRAGRAPDAAELSRMARTLHHRGPDGSGIVVSAACGFAHTRLAIIDPVGGAQPFASEDGTVVLTYNGEVFNYVELREELIAAGHRFLTASDTEVVLHAWIAWGEDAFLRFNGQFALALWDARRQRLVLARDRLGVRPLFTCHHAGRIYFASEIKAIFAADASIPRELDPIAIDDTLTFWTTVAPRTAFLGVEELRPGHLRIYDRGDVTERAFYALDYRPAFTGTIDDAVHAVGEALARATHLRMSRADVPVGAYLSGGLDSSLLAALARRETSARFATFAMRFEDDELDEGQFQRLVAQELDTEHHEVVIRNRDIAAIFPDVIAHAERPILRAAPAPLLLLAQHVRACGMKVVLSGEGADEMFAGYDLFREAKIRRFWTKEPTSQRRPRLLERLYPYLARSPVKNRKMANAFFGSGLEDPDALDYAHDPRWRATSHLKRLLAPELVARLGGRDARAMLLASLPREVASFGALARDQYLEIHTLLSGYLLSSQGDRMAMASAVEGRLPFLDIDVVALANALPADYKLRVLDEKHVLKRAAASLVPSRIIRRKKQPYRAPDALSFVGADAPEWIADLLDEKAVRNTGVFDPVAVRSLHAKVRATAPGQKLSNFDNMALVGVLSTQLLHAELVERKLVPRSLEVAS